MLNFEKCYLHAHGRVIIKRIDRMRMLGLDTQEIQNHIKIYLDSYKNQWINKINKNDAEKLNKLHDIVLTALN